MRKGFAAIPYFDPGRSGRPSPDVHQSQDLSDDVQSSRWWCATSAPHQKDQWLAPAHNDAGLVMPSVIFPKGVDAASVGFCVTTITIVRAALTASLDRCAEFVGSVIDARDSAHECRRASTPSCIRDLSVQRIFAGKIDAEAASGLGGLFGSG